MKDYKSQHNNNLTNEDIGDNTIDYVISACRKQPKSAVVFYLTDDKEITKLSKRVLYGLGNELDAISFRKILFSNGSSIHFTTDNKSMDNTIIYVK